jgi:hypothetical protein
MSESQKAVLNAWYTCRFAKSGSFRTLDGKLYSYSTVIGETVWQDNRKVLQIVDLGFQGVSRTTAKHINIATHFAKVQNLRN